MQARLLINARRVGKRAALIFESLGRDGHDVSIYALPREPVNLQSFEDEGAKARARILPVRALFSLRGGEAMIFVVMHWYYLPLIPLITRRRDIVIYDEYDFYQMILREGSPIKKYVLAPLVEFLNRTMLRYCDFITCIGMKDRILQRYLSRFNDNVLEINNYPSDRWLITDESLTAKPADAGVKLVFSGGIYAFKGCKMIAQAFLGALNADPALAHSTELHFFGFGDEKLIGWLDRQRNIVVHTHPTTEDIQRFLIAHNCVGLALYDDRPRHHLYARNSRKLYEYLALGTPVITTNVGEIGPFVRDRNVGFVIKPDYSQDELIALLREVLGQQDKIADLSCRAAAVVRNERLLWEEEWAKFREFLEAAIQRRASP